MRATEFITELFKPGKNWEWTFRGSEEAIAVFDMGDIEYLWIAAVENKRQPAQWTVSFRQRDQAEWDKAFGLTGTGSSTEVMSTVVDITREFLKQYGDKVLELRFSSKEESRSKLYARMVKRLLPDWNLHTMPDIMNGGSLFYLTNPRAYELEEDMTRRGFLGGLAGLAAGGAAAKQSPVQPKKVEPVQQPQAYNLLSNNTTNELAMMKAAKKAGFKGPELAQFMAQMKHESWDFERLKEKPQPGVKGYFSKKYDPKFAPKTAKILGNNHVGDGEKYHGRGFIQLTGRDNYRMAGQALNIDLLNQPELASKPDIAAKIAVWYWNTRVKPGINNFADTKAVTQKINPAAKGLENRHENFKHYLKIL